MTIFPVAKPVAKYNFGCKKRLNHLNSAAKKFDIILLLKIFATFFTTPKENATPSISEAKSEIQQNRFTGWAQQSILCLPSLASIPTSNTYRICITFAEEKKTSGNPYGWPVITFSI